MINFYQINHIALQIGDAVISGAIIIQCMVMTVGIVGKVERIVTVGLLQQLSAGIEVVMSDGIHGVGIIGIGDTCGAVVGVDQASVVFQGKGGPPGQFKPLFCQDRSSLEVLLF